MGILTNQTAFTGTPVGNDVIHIVDVSDTTDDPSGSSFKIPLSGLSSFFSTVDNDFWTSGSTGTGSIKTVSGNNISLGAYSVAQGFGTSATTQTAHSEGLNTLASGNNSHAEGESTIANALASHAEGGNTTASDSYAHAEGFQTTASGNASHAEGFQTTASNSYAHASGWLTTASGLVSFAHGRNNVASGDYSTSSGGQSNDTDTSWSFIGGGLTNIISGSSEGYSAIIGGTGNQIGASGVGSAIIGGGTNNSNSNGSVILGGQDNEISSGNHNGTLGGHQHTISGSATDSAIIGGLANIVSDNNVVVLGCSNLTALSADTVYIPDLYIDNCPAYADDATAGAAGLVTGMVYQGDGFGMDIFGTTIPLGALMIKQ